MEYIERTQCVESFQLFFDACARETCKTVS